MLTKFDMEHPIESYQDLQKALWWCTQSKNACSLKRGFAPEVLVLGKQTRLPGSVNSDHLLPAHCLADSDTSQGIAFRKQLAMRETARRAFHSADNDAALRKAMLRRSNPHRGSYQAGEWVMIWRKPPTMNGPGLWVGPMKVIVQEGQLTVWTTMSGKLYRSAPENVRPTTAHESRQILVLPQDTPLETLREQVQNLSNTMSPLSQEIPSDPNSPPRLESIPPIDTQPIPDDTSNTNIRPVSPVDSQQPGQEPEAMPVSTRPATPEVSHPAQPETVPVPDTDDEDLVCEGLYCIDAEVNAIEAAVDHEDLAWKCEILVAEDDIQAWKNANDPQEMAFLVSAAKKQRAEVKLSTLSPSEKAEFDVAKKSEIQNWLKTDTVKRIARSQLSEEQILRCRWILTWKPLDPSDVNPTNPKTHKAKARLVALGYLDPKIIEIPRDSPTLSRHSKLLILQLIASKGWDLRSFDVKAAFLQGRPQSDRVIGLEPVAELREAMSLRHSEIVQLQKGAYGLIDAPYLWYVAFREELLKLEFTESPFDPCTFILRCPKTGAPEGIIGIHVDDGICGGSPRFLEKLKALEKVYPFGAQKLGQFYLHRNRHVSTSQQSHHDVPRTIRQEDFPNYHFP